MEIKKPEKLASVKIRESVLVKVKSHVKKSGQKIGWFIETATEEKIERNPTTKK